MSVDAATVRRIARLSRIELPEADVPAMQGEINAILGFVAQLGEVDVDGVAPMTSVTPMMPISCHSSVQNYLVVHFKS